MFLIRPRRLRFALIALFAIAAPSLAQPAATALETRAFQLGAEAASRAQSDRTNAEALIAERYRQALDLSPDPAVQSRLKEAFERGYRSAVPGTPASTLPSAPPSSSAQQEAQLADLTMAHGVEQGRPIGSTDSFTPDDNPIYVWFRPQAVPAGATVVSDWFYDEPTPALRITEGRTVVDQAATFGQFNVDLAPGKKWPAGRYHVELRIGDRLVAQTRFRVADAAAPRAAAAGTPYVHPSAGYQIAPPPGWSVNDRVPTADVQMKAPEGTGLVEITSGPVSVRLDPISYAAGWESASVGPGRRLLSKRAGHETTLAGEMAYEGVYEGDGVLVKVLFVGVPKRFWVMTGVFPTDEFARGEPLFDAMTRTFRPTR